MSLQTSSAGQAQLATRSHTSAQDPDTQSRNKTGGTQVELCSIRVAQTNFGIFIGSILEIVGGALPQPVPLAPEFVGGLIHYRGDVLTTVSLRSLLGLPPKASRQDVLVLEGCSPGNCFGLLVDSVGEVLTVSAADYEPNPPTLDGRKRALFAGAYKMKDGLLAMLDPRLLDPGRLDAGRLDTRKPEV